VVSVAAKFRTPKFRVIIEFKALLNASDDCVVLDVPIILGFFKHSVSEIESGLVIKHLLKFVQVGIQLTVQKQ